MQVLGVDAVDRRERAAEHVVAAVELVRALDRDHVARLLHDADRRAVAALVLADAAARPHREVEADLALPDRLLHLADGVGERQRLLVGGAQDVEGQPLRGALADAGQARELGDQPVDGRSEHQLEAGQPRLPSAQAAERPCRGASSCAAQLLRRAQRLVERREDHVLEQLDVLGVHRLRIDRDLAHLEVAA